MKKTGAFGAAGGASLIAVALLLTPAFATSGPRDKLRPPAPTVGARSIGTFTPATSDPRLSAVLQRRGTAPSAEIRFTPATTAGDRNRAVRVAIRARATTPAEAERTVAQTSATPVTALTPVSYNLGASVGWRRFALSGDVERKEGGVVPGARESAEIGMSYRATRRITGRVEVGAERSEGPQRLVADDDSYSLDVGGSYSIARNLDLTGGVQYRISKDRIEPIDRDQRRDSQAVYVGTAFRF